MTEQTQAAAPAAAETPAVPAPQVEVTEAAIWSELQQADETANGDVPAAEPPAPEPEPEPAPSAATAAVDAAPPAPTPEDKAAQEAAKLEHRIRSDQGRLEALQRRIHAASATPSRELPPAREAIAGIRSDYPELAEPLDKLAEAVDGTRADFSRATQDSLAADQAELEAIVAENTATLIDRHPDYIDVLKANGPAFGAWVDDQPLRIRQAAIRNANYIADGRAAVEVVEAFKKHLGLIKEPAAPGPAPAPQPSLDDRRQRQIQGSATPQRSGGRPTISGIPEEGDPKAIWDAFEAQDRARA